MYQEKERKYKDVKTTELLDFVGIHFDYTEDKERDKQSDYKDELEEREPHKSIKRKIDQMETAIRQLQDKLSELLNHSHKESGEIVIPIKKDRFN